MTIGSEIMKWLKEKISIITLIGAALILILSFILGEMRAVKVEAVDKNQHAVSEVKTISVADYLELFKSSEKSIIYIGDPGCGACQQINPVLDSIINQYDVVINFVNLSNLQNEEGEALYNSHEFLRGGEWGIPLILVVSESDIIDKHVGSADETTMINFLKTNGFIN
jgi:predicted bacteriocin transport accessory protein